MTQVESTRPGAVPAGDDWPAQAADTIVRVVGQVRDKTTGPAITATRGLVYGTLAAILGTTALVILTILLVRGMVIIINDILGAFDADKPGRAVWITEVLIGAVFTLGGVYCFRKALAPRRAT